MSLRARCLCCRLAIVVTAVAITLMSGDLDPANADEAKLGHRKTAWEGSTRGRAPIEKFATEYMRFLGAYKTEREVVGAALKMAARKGHRDLFAAKRPAVRPGARLMAEVNGKLAALIVIGSEPLAEGMHLVASHIDAVRIDLKQQPIYADGNLALLQTHYYGGIKKYQWLSVPLELRGVVVTSAGKRIDVAIGDQLNEPVLVIPDIAPHVSHYVDRKEGERVPGEKLDAIISSTPGGRAGTDRFAAQAAALLRSEYGIDVADLASAELELVPAGLPREVGIDRALIGGYGHDDRSCSYAALRAILGIRAPKHTAVVVLADKEEIGSHGNTGARSVFIRRVVAELLEGGGVASTEAAVDRVMAASMVFSADVSGAANPLYPDVYEKGNAAFVGSGLIWNKGAIHAEVMGYVRRLFDGAKVAHQPADWAKTSDGSDSGTVLEYFTRHGMRGLDVAIPLLSMHAPFELISKVDLYEAYRGYGAFLAD